MMPVTNPIAIDPPGLRMIPADAPITTPPARVEFRRCSSVNFFLRPELIIKVPRQLPVSARIVLVMICVLVYCVVAKTPKLNDGQYIQRNKVPIKANMFEK